VTADIDDGFEFKEHDMAVTHAVRYIVPAVLVSLVCASAAPAQTPAPAQASNLQGPKCLRLDHPLLMTMCSLGLDLHPIEALRERRGAVDADVVAPSFEQLAVLVRPGNTVMLMDASGSRISGRIDTLTSSAVSLVVNGSRRDFHETDVAAIWQRRGDPLGNGARRGFFIGGALGALSVLGCMGECWDSWASAAGGMSLMAVIGTGIGISIDALSRERQTIYRRPAIPAARVTLAPHRAGASVSLRF
jgi:hypothetical protein